jgi:hypothetical protein
MVSAVANGVAACLNGSHPGALVTLHHSVESVFFCGFYLGTRVEGSGLCALLNKKNISFRGGQWRRCMPKWQPPRCANSDFYNRRKRRLCRAKLANRWRFDWTIWPKVCFERAFGCGHFTVRVHDLLKAKTDSAQPMITPVCQRL